MAIYIYYLIINLITFAVFAADKRKAIEGSFRVPERTLLILGFLGGAAGGILAMKLTHHKTRKPKFYILMPLFLLWNLAVLWLLSVKGFPPF